MNWGIPRYLYSRAIRTLSPNTSLKRGRTPEEIADDGRGDGSPFTKRSTIQRYGDRLRHFSGAAAPVGPHPWASPNSWGWNSRDLRIRSCSLFGWVCVVSREKNAYAWNPPARVVRVTPYLNFCASSMATEKYYYESFRVALLAYVAFPKRLLVGCARAHAYSVGFGCRGNPQRLCRGGSPDGSPAPRPPLGRLPGVPTSKVAFRQGR